MTIFKRYTAPTLPLPPQDYAQTYGNELIKILRLYFDNNDATVNAVIALLNAGGYFPSLTAGTVTAGDFIGGDFVGDNITVTNANFPILNSPGIQGGNGVFNQLTGANVNASLFTGSGRQINFPHIAASDSTDQVAGGNDTPTVVNFNTLDSGLGWTLNSPGSATAEYAGVYKITYSLQFVNTANAIHSAVVWLQKNGSDVANSATEFSIPARKSASIPSYVAGYSEAVFEVVAGDEIELYWATDLAGNPTTPTDGIYIFHDAAKTVAGGAPYNRPAIPSVIGSIVYLSAPPDPKTQITPIGVLGSGRIGTPVIDIVNNTA
jgi:hypothetical protein